MATSERRCGAHNRFGESCKQRPILGGTECVAHGGRSPQVKRAARERLAAMVDPCLTELFRIALHGESEAVRLAAIKDLLDRAGYKAKDQVETSGRMTIEVVYGDDVEKFGRSEPATGAPVMDSGPEEWMDLARLVRTNGDAS